MPSSFLLNINCSVSLISAVDAENIQTHTHMNDVCMCKANSVVSVEKVHGKNEERLSRLVFKAISNERG